MTYNNVLEKIDSLLVFGSQPGLSRIQTLLDRMGNPQNDLNFVHVAGTNGKGSVCNMLAGILKAAGLRTGLFTSPHITGFGERMQIDGCQIAPDDVAAQVEALFPLVEDLRSEGVIITEFEFVTAMAFNYFRDKHCDIVVLETGLGGRFDATNVIKTPLCSVITSISFDHTAILGDTLDKIAFEKCGIIKQGGNVVFMPQEAEVNSRIETTAKERGNVLYTAQPMTAEETSLDGTRFVCEGQEIVLPLLGEHQMKNFSLVYNAVLALRSAGYNITAENIKAGAEGVRLPARFEVLSNDPLIIADGAHNPDGMKALSGAIDKYLAGKNIFCVLGMLRDKDCRNAVKNLCGRVVQVFATTVPDNPRRQSAEELKQTVDRLLTPCTACEDPHEAVDRAIEAAKAADKSAVLICGSLYLVSELRNYVGTAIK